MQPPAADAHNQRRSLLVATIVVIGLSLSVAYHYVQTAYLKAGYPLSTFLFRPFDRFGDWYKPYRDVFEYNAGGPFRLFQYTPFSHLMITGFRLVPATLGFAMAIAALVAVLVAAFGVLGMRAVPDGRLRVLLTFVLVFLTYPFLFALDRGNVEMIVFVLLAAFVYLYVMKGSGWGLVFLAAAAAMKIFPATLIVLPLADRRFRDAALTALGAVALTVGSAWLLGVKTAHTVGAVWASTAQVLLWQADTNGLQIQHGHSLWGMFALAASPFASAEAIHAWQRWYAVLVLVLFAGIAAYVVLVEKEPWRRVALLVGSAVLFPFVSADYTLLHWLLPVALFVGAAAPSRRETLFAVLLAVPLIPLDYIYFEFPALMRPVGSSWITETSTSVALYPLAILALMALIVVDGLVRARRGTAAEEVEAA